MNKLSLIRVRVVLLWVLASVAPTSFGQEAGTICTATVNGQSVAVNTDGTFRVSNIPVSSDLVRVNLVCTGDGPTQYGQSEFFLVTANGSYSIGEIELSTTPPATTVDIFASAADPILTQVGETTQVTVLASKSDGSTDVDVTARVEGSTYTSSNASVVTVTEDGVAQAVGDGTAFITARNEGATAVTPVIVNLGAATNIIGFVQFEDGSPAVGADVRLSLLGVSTTTSDAGMFSFPDVPTDKGPFTVTASTTLGTQTYQGTRTGLDAAPPPNEFTDAGIIGLKPGIYNGGFELGTFDGYTTEGVTAVLPNLEFVLPPEGDFMAFASTGSDLTTVGRILVTGLAVPPSAKYFRCAFNFMTDELDEAPVYDDIFEAFLRPEGGQPIRFIHVSKNDMLNGKYEILDAPSGFDGMTGFLLGEGDISAYAGKRITLDFCFRVTDVGDTSVESAILLDLLRFE